MLNRNELLEMEVKGLTKPEKEGPREAGEKPESARTPLRSALQLRAELGVQEVPARRRVTEP